MDGRFKEYWSQSPPALLEALAARGEGLTPKEAAVRLTRFGPNRPLPHRERATIQLLLRQLANPLVLILALAAAVALVVQDWLDGAIILTILLGSVLLSFFQERRASQAMERLQRRAVVHAQVLRDGRVENVPAAEVVPGDVVLLSAGSLVPADGVLLAADDLYLNEAVLTGETLPVEKRPGALPARTGLAARSNCVHAGSSVRSGSGRALIVHTGRATTFGAVAERLAATAPETQFEHGVRHFGYLLSQVMLALLLLVFAINVFMQRPPVDSLLFALALAVGLSPQLLPAILSLTLSRGAQDLAGQGVIVRRLNAIENLGSMDVLCTDKTGTLTEGTVRLAGAYDPAGAPADDVLRLARINAALQASLPSPLDEALLAGTEDVASVQEKLDEIPYDFARKRLSVIVRDGPDARLIVKGAFMQLLPRCARLLTAAGERSIEPDIRAELLRQAADWGEQGLRVLGVATRAVPVRAEYPPETETELTFVGFLCFFDPPKAGIEAAIAELRGLGIELKIITGDSRHAATALARRIGLPAPAVLAGDEMSDLTEEALWQRAACADVFAEVDPGQKERIIRALQHTGHVVGYLGDGINDAPALHAADAGVSVDDAVDVAREAADLVLVEQDLNVLRRGVEEGRRIFANTMKYIFTVTSANFGNMISMALASLFLPFLPLLAKQILLNNFLADWPSMLIARDRVDPVLVERPLRWDVRAIREFMLTFGPASSLFDLLTFALLLGVFAAGPELFRTGWFVESLLTQLLIIYIVRTRGPFWQSRPAAVLMLVTAVVLGLALMLPYLPINAYLGFVPLPGTLLLALVVITLVYLLTSEALKRRFYRRLASESAQPRRTFGRRS